jgi:hypothetical protein
VIIFPWFEAIVATGSVLPIANLAQATMMILDGMQPCGVTTLVLIKPDCLSLRRLPQ